MRSWVLDRIAELKAQRRYIQDKEEALSVFGEQQAALQAIASTEWFQELRNYWLRLLDLSIWRLSTCKGRAYEDAQIEYKTTKDFLDFLDSRTSKQELPDL